MDDNTEQNGAADVHLESSVNNFHEVQQVQIIVLVSSNTCLYQHYSHCKLLTE